MVSAVDENKNITKGNQLHTFKIHYVDLVIFTSWDILKLDGIILNNSIENWTAIHPKSTCTMLLKLKGIITEQELFGNADVNSTFI